MPNFRDIQTVTAISHLRANASWSGISAGSDTQVAAYNPPDGWVILDTQVEVHSTSNGSRSISTLAGGLNLATEKLIDKVYSDAIKAAGKYKDKAAKAALETERKDRIQEVIKFSTNKNTVYASVHAEAHGSLIDRKRGWDEISVVARIFYVGTPSSADLEAELERRFRIRPSRFATSDLDFKDKELDFEEDYEGSQTLETILNA